ncbi:MAG: hypothetical protein J7M11_03795, partial [Elusimicrobia bacterium]|nr:hypothetical protein [Elusimicrobiota bacterium]
MEENREAFGEDMDIENLAAVLSDTEGSDGQKEAEGAPGREAAPSQSIETPVFSDEPAPPSEEPAAAETLSAADEPAAPSVPEKSGASESESSLDSGESKSESPLPGGRNASDSEDGDIESLIKKYEEIPTGKKEIVKKNRAAGKTKSLPVVPIAAAAGVI